MWAMSAHDQAVDIALANILNYCDGATLCAVLPVSRPWRIIFCCQNMPQQMLFRNACLQRWPWLQGSLAWSHCGHHLWHHYLGNWQALFRDDNRANAVCSLHLVVPLGAHAEARPCVQGPWVSFPERDLQLRINAYPIGNRRMTTTHLSAYLEVQAPQQKTDWHAALDFTFTMRHPGCVSGELSWSSGPVRFMEPAAGAGGRLDWGCHELLPIGLPPPPTGEVAISAHVSLQEALVEVLHADWLPRHANDFGLCGFGSFELRPRGKGSPPASGGAQTVRLTLPASTTKAELLAVVSEALGLPVKRLWRFSRSREIQGRLACSLPEAPRHLLADDALAAQEAEDTAAGVYGLLTKWTLGESSGGTRQNFFRLLAEGGPEHAAPPAPPGWPSPVQAFVKLLLPGRGLQFESTVLVPSTEDPGLLLPPILERLGLQSPAAAGGVAGTAEEWCLAWEGSPPDWAEAPPGCANEEHMGGCDPSRELVNGHGAVVHGDVLVLCLRRALPELAAIYQQGYRRRVAEFVSLHAREAALPGSCTFASLCQALDRLNVDAWRLEQLLGGGLGAGGPAAAAAAAHAAQRPLLALLQSLPGLHPQFFCDACGTRELRGCRFNCLVCSDFDLCAACYQKQPDVLRPKDHNGRYHDKSHRMILVRPALPVNCLRSLDGRPSCAVPQACSPPALVTSLNFTRT